MTSRIGAGNCLSQKCLAIVCGLLLSLSSALAKEPLVLAGPPWEPFLYEDDPGTGLAAEIVTAAFAESGYEVEILPLPWRRIMWHVEAQEIDGVVGVWRSEERDELMKFSTPYHVNRIVIASHHETPIIDGRLEHLHGQKVGFRRGAYYGDAIMGNDDIERLAVSNDRNMLHMLAAQRLDAGIGDYLILERIIRSNPHLQARVHLDKESLVDIPIHVGMVEGRGDADQRTADFNRGLQKLHDSGRLQEILQSYDVESLPVLISEQLNSH